MRETNGERSYKKKYTRGQESGKKDEMEDKKEKKRGRRGVWKGSRARGRGATPAPAGRAEMCTCELRMELP